MSATFPERLILVLGDQLDLESAALRDADPGRDVVFMAEVARESEKVWSHKARIAVFLASMRAFRRSLEARGFRVWYAELARRAGDPGIQPDRPDRRNLTQRSEFASLGAALEACVSEIKPARLSGVRPGEYDVRVELEACAQGLDLPLEWRADIHFLCSRDEFQEWARDRKELRLEFFYRWMRRRTGLLMQADGEPVGGQWNFDADNRKSLPPRSRRDPLPAPLGFAPNPAETPDTQAVLELVAERFAEHPGDLQNFDWPVTRKQALAALDDFLENRLPRFGDFQDALAEGEPWLYHSRLSAALNLKLLRPLEVCEAAVTEYAAGRAPLNAVEGFVRQILGWREFVRGVYELYMPEYRERNFLEASEDLPAFYWTGRVAAVCLREALGQTLKYGYAHHIQRLMITGLFALLYGARPQQVHEWYLAVYVDAVEWVELPNTLGMSQYGDGGVMASKPYAASGKYIDRMSDYCKSCRYDPGAATGETACPFTTLYWDFLLRNAERLRGNARFGLQLKNADRLSPERRQAIQQTARRLRERVRKFS